MESTMRVAALFDIHGNIDALDAVVAEVRREQVDLMWLEVTFCPVRCHAKR
jgi:hypothetical protein